MRGKLLGLNTYFPKQICDYLYLLKTSFLGHNKQLENSEWIFLSRKTGVRSVYMYCIFDVKFFFTFYFISLLTLFAIET